MAWYQDTTRVSQLSGDKDFDAIYEPGNKVPHSGIYICTGCRREVTCNYGDPLPPQNSHQHTTSKPIRWRLLVYTNTSGAGGED
jgi:hypothetical protein